MATRLEEALHGFAKAMGSRPYVVVMAVSHPDAPVQNVGTVLPPAQPFYVTRGLLAEAHDCEQMRTNARTEYEERFHKKKENEDGGGETPDGP